MESKQKGVNFNCMLFPYESNIHAPYISIALVTYTYCIGLNSVGLQVSFLHQIEHKILTICHDYEKKDPKLFERLTNVVKEISMAKKELEKNANVNMEHVIQATQDDSKFEEKIQNIDDEEFDKLLNDTDPKGIVDDSKIDHIPERKLNKTISSADSIDSDISDREYLQAKWFDTMTIARPKIFENGLKQCMVDLGINTIEKLFGWNPDAISVIEIGTKHDETYIYTCSCWYWCNV